MQKSIISATLLALFQCSIANVVVIGTEGQTACGRDNPKSSVAVMQTEFGPENIYPIIACSKGEIYACDELAIRPSTLIVYVSIGMDHYKPLPLRDIIPGLPIYPTIQNQMHCIYYSARELASKAGNVDFNDVKIQAVLSIKGQNGHGNPAPYKVSLRSMEYIASVSNTFTPEGTEENNLYAVLCPGGRCSVSTTGNTSEFVKREDIFIITPGKAPQFVSSASMMAPRSHGMFKVVSYHCIESCPVSITASIPAPCPHSRCPPNTPEDPVTWVEMGTEGTASCDPLTRQPSMVETLAEWGPQYMDVYNVCVEESPEPTEALATCGVTSIEQSEILLEAKVGDGAYREVRKFTTTFQDYVTNRNAKLGQYCRILNPCEAAPLFAGQAFHNVRVRAELRMAAKKENGDETLIWVSLRRMPYRASTSSTLTPERLEMYGIYSTVCTGDSCTIAPVGDASTFTVTDFIVETTPGKAPRCVLPSVVPVSATRLRLAIYECRSTCPTQIVAAVPPPPPCTPQVCPPNTPEDPNTIILIGNEGRATCDPSTQVVSVVEMLTDFGPENLYDVLACVEVSGDEQLSGFKCAPRPFSYFSFRLCSGDNAEVYSRLHQFIALHPPAPNHRKLNKYCRTVTAREVAELFRDAAFHNVKLSASMKVYSKPSNGKKGTPFWLSLRSMPYVTSTSSTYQLNPKENYGIYTVLCKGADCNVSVIGSPNLLRTAKSSFLIRPGMAPQWLAGSNVPVSSKTFTLVTYECGKDCPAEIRVLVLDRCPIVVCSDEWRTVFSRNYYFLTIATLIIATVVLTIWKFSGFSDSNAIGVSVWLV